MYLYRCTYCFQVTPPRRMPVIDCAEFVKLALRAYPNHTGWEVSTQREAHWMERT